MSLKLCLILFLCYFINSASGQVSRDYIQYYQLISNAEIQIVDRNYDSALHYYNRAIEKAPLLKKDVYNVSKCCQLKESKADSFLSFLAKKKSTPEIFKKFQICTKVKEIEKRENQIIEIELLNYFDRIDSIFMMDQMFRKKSGSYSIYGDTISKIDSSNIELLQELMEKYGYPSRGNPKLTFKDNAYFIIRHHYQNRKNLTDILLTELEEGRIQPYMYAELEDKKSNWSAGKTTYGTVSFIKFQWGLWKNSIEEISFTKERTQEINAKRKLIGLPPLDYQKKMILLERKKKYPFYFGFYEGFIYFKGKPKVK